MLVRELYEKTKETGIFRHYDKHCGRFFIYFDDLNESIVSGMLEFLRNGWVMDVADGGDEDKMYVLFSIKDDTSGCRKLKVCRECLYDWLHNEKGIHYFTTMSMKQYMGSERYQKAIDYVLEKAVYTDVDGWTIALLINENGDFEFVEVLDACA